jgi:hypothetical protein
MLNPYTEFLPETTVVTAMQDADFCLAKVADLDAQIEEIQESAEVQIKRIQGWKESRVCKVERKKEFYLEILRGFILSTGMKTVDLVNGALTLRKQQDEIVIEDEDAVLKDSRFVRVKMMVDKATIRKHLMATGEIPDGVAVKPKEVKFGYKVSR